MSRRRKNDVSLFDMISFFVSLFTLVGLLFYAFWKIIEWLFIGIVKICVCIGNLIEKASNKTTTSNNYCSNSQTKQEKLSPRALNYNNINYKEDIQYESRILKIPKYTVKTPYDNLFETLIIKRGIDYFNSGKIENFRIEGQTCFANIVGTNTYNSQITFYKNKKIKKAECTCPYYGKDNKYCKHIYALLLNYCDNKKIDGFLNEKYYEERKEQIPVSITKNAYSKLSTICSAIKEILDNTQDYYDELEDIEEIEDCYNIIMAYEDNLKEYQNTKVSDINQQVINKAQDDLDTLKELYDDLELNIEEIEEQEYFDESNNDPDEFFSGAIAGGFIANEIYKQNQRKLEELKEQKEKEKLKREWGLLDWEADLVQKGEYDPWQFSEPDEGDELDEDDYYHDD